MAKSNLKQAKAIVAKPHVKKPLYSASRKYKGVAKEAFLLKYQEAIAFLYSLEEEEIDIMVASSQKVAAMQ